MRSRADSSHTVWDTCKELGVHPEGEGLEGGVTSCDSCTLGDSGCSEGNGLDRYRRAEGNNHWENLAGSRAQTSGLALSCSGVQRTGGLDRVCWR